MLEGGKATVLENCRRAKILFIHLNEFCFPFCEVHDKCTALPVISDYLFLVFFDWTEEIEKNNGSLELTLAWLLRESQIPFGADRNSKGFVWLPAHQGNNLLNKS